jgi:hypothetical protein
MVNIVTTGREGTQDNHASDSIRRWLSYPLAPTKECMKLDMKLGYEIS